MKLTQIRNATNRLEYAGTTFLIDPWLAPKHTLSFENLLCRGKEPVHDSVIRVLTI